MTAPFDHGVTFCPKCGARIVPDVKWVAAWAPGRCREDPCPVGEHVHRSCPRCGYWWAEKTADAE